MRQQWRMMPDDNDKPAVDPQPRRRVPPPTIDLQATETEGPSRRFAFGRFLPSTGQLATAGIGAALALIAVVGVWLLLGRDLLPGDRADDATARLDRIEAQLGTLAQKTVPSGAGATDAKADTKADAKGDAKALEELSRRLARIESAAPAVPGAPASDAALAELNRRLDEAMSAARAARERADAAAKSVADAPRTSAPSDADRASDRAALDALAARVASLEGAAKSLADRLARSNDASAAGTRDAVAALALRLAVERGGAYARELAAIDPVHADKAVRDALAPFAASGVPAAPVLARELAALMPAARKAAEAPAHDGGGILDRLQTSAERLVRVRPIGEPSGDEPDAVLARIDSAAARTDLGAALAEAAKLPPAARVPLEPWIKRAQARDAALAAMTVLVDRALDAARRPAQGAPTR